MTVRVTYRPCTSSVMSSCWRKGKKAQIPTDNNEKYHRTQKTKASKKKKKKFSNAITKIKYIKLEKCIRRNLKR